MIKVRQLSKRLGERVIFRRLEFDWEEPGTICLCGVNGSGKTTLLSLLAGASAPDSGSILVQGCDLVAKRQEAARLVSYVPDDCPVYPFVSGAEWLAFIKSLRSHDERIEQELLAQFKLQPHLQTRFGEMSLGTAKKFLLTSALMCSTPILILDEPTNGLDQASFAVLRHFLAMRRNEGIVVLSCHDAEQQHLLGARRIELAALEA